jgi:hypothetical protein
MPRPGIASILFPALRQDRARVSDGRCFLELTAVDAGFSHHDRARFAFLVAATVFFVVAGLITRLLNQPSNKVVIAWLAEDPPPNWAVVRDAMHASRAHEFVGYVIQVCGTVCSSCRPIKSDDAGIAVGNGMTDDPRSGNSPLPSVGCGERASKCQRGGARARPRTVDDF